MKRFFISLLALSLVLSLCGCRRQPRATPPVPTPTAAPPVTAAVTVQTPAPTEAPQAESAAPSMDLSALMQDAAASGVSLSPLALPPDSGEFSLPLAQQALALCTGHTAAGEAALLEQAGFTLLLQNGYDKSDTDPGHTCAYTVGSKQVYFGGVTRTLFLVAVRGTNAGEWYSNFDFAPSHSDGAVFAENFLFAAQDVFLGIQEVLDAAENPLLLLCGHSRGAACANLLGLLLNAQYGPENCYVYTYATPATVRDGAPEADCGNIFNLLNPCDPVPRLPLADWGFRRLGTDILLPGDEGEAQTLDDSAAALFGIAPTISQYYGARHATDGPGRSEDGLTAFELMLSIAGRLADMTGGGSGGSSPELSENCDFAPLVRLLEQAGENGGAAGMALARQHMPATYHALIAAMAVQK